MTGVGPGAGRRLGLLALAVLAASVLVGGGAAAAVPETTGIRLVDAPTSRADDPRARLYIVDHLKPGTTIHRRVEVSNDTDSPHEFQLYPAAATVTNGLFEFGEGRAANDLTAWTTVEPGTMTLAPRSRGTATVTIAVPRTASAGERYGVVWQEVGTPAPKGGGIRMVNRVGIRIYLSVGPGGEPPSDFSVGSLEGHRDPDGTPIVRAEVGNTGGRALEVAGELRLSHGPAGLSAGPFPVELGADLGVGQRRTLVVRMDAALPDGPWDGVLALRAGTLERTATHRLSFPAAPAAPVDPATSPTPASPDGEGGGSSRVREAAIVGSISLIAVTTSAAVGVGLVRGAGWFSLFVPLHLVDAAAGSGGWVRRLRRPGRPGRRPRSPR